LPLLYKVLWYFLSLCGWLLSKSISMASKASRKLTDTCSTTSISCCHPPRTPCSRVPSSVLPQCCCTLVTVPGMPSLPYKTLCQASLYLSFKIQFTVNIFRKSCPWMNWVPRVYLPKLYHIFALALLDCELLEGRDTVLSL
jgi:hypothetical protein